MGWQERMNQAISWIERHLADEIDWTRAAREANCSHYHFLRMFEVITGITPADYVRRRRLSLAAVELGLGGMKVIDLAQKYGYESPDAFAKAFRRLFGCTPSEARQSGQRLRSFGPISFSIALKGSRPLDYRIVKRAGFSMTGLPRRIPAEPECDAQAIPAFWAEAGADGRLGRLVKRIPAGSPLRIAGVCTEHAAPGGELAYLIAIETPADRQGLPEGCVDLWVPPSTWGVFESVGPLPAALQETWLRIWEEWLPASGYQETEGPQLETFLSMDAEDPHFRNEIWIPLMKKPD